MRRQSPLSLALLFGLLPLFAVALALHVREAARNGLAQPAFFVANPPSADAYPRVRGFRLEQSGGADSLTRIIHESPLGCHSRV